MARTPPPRILCLSPFFVPQVSAEAFCGGKVALNLIEAEVDLTVFAVDYTGHAKFSRDGSALWQPLAEITRAVTPAAGLSKYWSAPLGLRYLTAEWSRWIHSIVSAARRLHNERPFDVVYSRSLPNVAHIAGYWVAKAIDRPWVTNFNDPWDLEGAHLLPQHRNQRKRNVQTVFSDLWLRRIMRTADVLTFPCSRLRDYHLQFVRPQGKCVVIPHIGHRMEKATSSEFFQLVHAGNLGSGESTRRNTTVGLLRGLRTFLDRRPEAGRLFRLVLVGPEDRPTLALAKELGLEHHVLCTGRLSYSESVQRMTGATVCLLVEGDMPEGIYLPSKFPDYIQSNKPVIALSPAIGTIADLLPTPGVTQVQVHDPEAIVNAIARHYDAFVKGELDTLRPTPELRSLYDGHRIGAAIRDLCTSLMKQSRV